MVECLRLNVRLLENGKTKGLFAVGIVSFGICGLDARLHLKLVFFCFFFLSLALVLVLFQCLVFDANLSVACKRINSIALICQQGFHILNPIGSSCITRLHAKTNTKKKTHAMHVRLAHAPPAAGRPE